MGSRPKAKIVKRPSRKPRKNKPIDLCKPVAHRVVARGGHDPFWYLLSATMKEASTPQEPPKVTRTHNTSELPKKFTPTHECVKILGVLAESKTTLTVPKIVGSLAAKRHHLADGTIKKELKLLIDKGYAHRPNGERKGTALTDKGRSLAAEIKL